MSHDQTAAPTPSAVDTQADSEAASVAPATDERMPTPSRVVLELKPSLPTGKRAGIAINTSSEVEPKPKRMRASDSCVKPSSATKSTARVGSCKSQKVQRRESDSSTGSSSSSVTYGPTDLRPNLFSSWNSPRLLARSAAAQAAAIKMSASDSPADSEATSVAPATRLPKLSPVAVTPKKTVKVKKLGTSKERSVALPPVGASSPSKNKPGHTTTKQSSTVLKTSQPASLLKKRASVPRSEEAKLKGKRADMSKTKLAGKAKQVSVTRTAAPVSRLPGSSTSAKSTRLKQSTTGFVTESGASARGGAREQGQQRQRQQQKQPWKR